MDTLHIFWIFSKVYMNKVSSSSDLGHWLILHMQERGEMVGSKPHGDFIVLAAWDVLGPNENPHFEGLVDDAQCHKPAPIVTHVIS